MFETSVFRDLYILISVGISYECLDKSIVGSSHEYECGQNKLNGVLISQIDARFGKFKAYFLVMYMVMESHCK